jgi:calcineurin-like phosphoesterase family protein
MSNVYLISDLHLGHLNMAIRRGFSNVEDHDNHVIEKWNSVINKKDTVWILGDITMEKTQPYRLLDELKGIKNVVLGNHDLPQHVPELLKYTNKVCGSFSYKGCILTHIPINEFELRRFRYNIHGHLHSNVIEDQRYINVSCERVEYTPILLNELIKINK